jgi:hypothetical protein
VVPVHEGGLHCTEGEDCWQAPPEQNPVLPQVPPVGQRPCGSGSPLATVVQLPVPERLQTWQVPQAADMQQTPSVQWPVPHSWSRAHEVPGERLGTQLPLGPVQ